MAELIAGILSTSLYKRSQGKVARQVTFLAIVAVIAIGAWHLSSIASNEMGRYVWPLVILGLGAFLAFRIVHIPRFADFLIAVEAEMNKVSWPGRDELIRASMVVIVVIFMLVIVLYLYDVLLRYVVSKILNL